MRKVNQKITTNILLMHIFIMTHKFRFIFIALLIEMVICTQTVISQTNTETKKAQTKNIMVGIYVGLSGTDKSSVEHHYDFIDQLAEFPGGEQKLQEYISQNLRYPTAAKDKCIQGKVIVSFVIFETGKIGICQIGRSLYPDCDKEALRIVQSMPNWIPAKKDGKNIAICYSLPISFKLPKTAGTEIKPVDGK